MILLLISAEIKPHRRLEFEQAAGMILEGQDYPKECLTFALNQQLDQQNRYSYTEEWQSREALDSHLQCDDFRALLGAMKVLGEIRNARIITSESVESMPTDQ